MQHKNYIIHTDGSITPYEPSNPSSGYTLDELSKAVGGGYIELVNPMAFHGYYPHLVMVVDEEGHIKGLPVNPIASAIHVRHGAIHGDVLICESRLIA